MNWLERARREIPNTPYKGTAKTAETDVSSVMTVPHRGISENSIPTGDNARAALRVYEYRLSDYGDKGPWLILLAPGCDLAEAERSLRNRFGVDRVLAVRERMAP